MQREIPQFPNRPAAMQNPRRIVLVRPGENVVALSWRCRGGIVISEAPIPLYPMSLHQLVAATSNPVETQTASW